MRLFDRGKKKGGDRCVTQIDKKKDAMIQDDSDKREGQESKKTNKTR